MKKQYIVGATGFILFAIFAIAAITYNQQKAKEIGAAAERNYSSLEREYSPTIGNPAAKVTIVEFFDPACGTCRAFHPFVKKFMIDNPGRIRLVMRYTPFHQGSDYVVKVLEAANLQGRFWEALEVTYETQQVWSSHDNPQPQKLWMRLGNIDLDINKASADMKSPEIAARINQDIADAKQLAVDKTPGFFVNGKPLIQFGYDQLQALVESEIKRQY